MDNTIQRGETDDLTSQGQELSIAELRQMRTWMDSQFREYMHSRQVLSTLSEGTQRRYRKSVSGLQRKNKEEDALLHRMIAALQVYHSDGVACAESGAHFASGLMAAAACECLAIVALIRRKLELRKCDKYKKLWARHKAQRNNSSSTMSKFLLSLRHKELFSLCRIVGAYSEVNLPGPVIAILKDRGYPCLTNFVQEARNCIHPGDNIAANDKYARVLDVMYSLEGMKSFHADFALCAWELHGRLEEGFQKEKH